MAARENAVELEARKEDEARAVRKAELDNQALIEASRPKTGKKLQAEEKKKEKMAKAAEARFQKALAKQANADEKALAKKTKAEEKAKVDTAKRAKRKEIKQATEAKLAKKQAGEWSEEDGSGDEDQEQYKVDFMDDINDEDALSCDKWVIMSHAISEVDGVTPFFRVAMYGYPPKHGEDEAWCERKDLVKDKAGPLIDEYIKEHANFQPYSDLLLPKPKHRKTIQATSPVEDNSSPCQHENYRDCYKMEDHPGFCVEGRYLHALTCGGVGCVRTFVSNLKEVRGLGKEKSSRPTADKPVYCCINMDKGVGASRKHECRHALCNPCWTMAMLDQDTDRQMTVAGKRKRATRTVIKYVEL